MRTIKFESREEELAFEREVCDTIIDFWHHTGQAPTRIVTERGEVEVRTTTHDKLSSADFKRAPGVYYFAPPKNLP